MNLAKKMLIYLADLYHDYMPTRQHVPLGIGFIGEYVKATFPGKVEIILFKSADLLLNTIDQTPPNLVGLSNYTWNESLNEFVGGVIKNEHNKDIPIVMGGPNIRIDEDGVRAFLTKYAYIDRYVLYAGERPLADIIKQLIELPDAKFTSDTVKGLDLNSSYSLVGGELTGGSLIDDEKNLDFVPSPYTSGALDEFLDTGFLPIIETNRGCPFSCTFCVWGISALNKIKQFSLERVNQELKYIAASGRTCSEIVFADANFGILKRDVEISQMIRDLYEEYKSFQAVQIYWSKSAQPHMIDMGKILGELTHTYVAFQSLDPVVLEAIKRKNISTDKLVTLINELKGYTHSTQTDLLVGLPNETYESHIRSLQEALRFGITLIQGGEIRMLPGSEMDSIESRHTYKLKTKYRLCEGQHGYYRGKMVAEFEEVVRQTSTITEAEMLSLRVLRTIFFASVTLGEHLPLISYMTKNNLPIYELFRVLAEPDEAYPAFNRALKWCSDQAQQEWFDSKTSAIEYFNEPANAKGLFGDKPFLKLNYGMYGRLICNADEYEDFCRKVGDTLARLIPEENSIVLSEIVQLCRARNLLYRTLNESQNEPRTIKLSDQTREVLKRSDYPTYTPKSSASGSWTLVINPLTEILLAEKIDNLDGDISILGISQILEHFRGRAVLVPLRL
jgi:radical SAM superfamily enzyme YgiQ (UPF0313 family)